LNRIQSIFGRPGKEERGEEAGEEGGKREAEEGGWELVSGVI